MVSETPLLQDDAGGYLPTVSPGGKRLCPSYGVCGLQSYMSVVGWTVWPGNEFIYRDKDHGGRLCGVPSPLSYGKLSESREWPFSFFSWGIFWTIPELRCRSSVSAPCFLLFLRKWWWKGLGKFPLRLEFLGPEGDPEA